MKNKKILTYKPKTWRQGQTIFNFLEWLSGTYPTTQSIRMADPFHIQDEELDKLYEQYMNEVNN